MFHKKPKDFNQFDNNELIAYIKKANRDSFIAKSLFVALLISGSIFASSLLNTKFGIGEVAPTAKLEVKGDGTTSATINTNLKNNANASLFYVRDDGNIGVGTALPAQKLDVNGNLRLTGKLLPNYESTWTYVVMANTELSFAHGLGTVPSHVEIYSCGAITGANCTSRQLRVNSSYNNGSGTGFTNPISVTFDNTNIYISIANGFSIFFYWNGVAYVCTGDADANCNTGYYKVKAWK